MHTTFVIYFLNGFINHFIILFVRNKIRFTFKLDLQNHIAKNIKDLTLLW